MRQPFTSWRGDARAAFVLSFAGLLLPSVPLEADATREPAPAATRLFFSGSGHTGFGDWSADGVATSAAWSPGATVRLDVRLRLAQGHLPAMAVKKLPASEIAVLVTAERAFDADGWLRLPSDERMSTLLTPAGLAIEGGVVGAVTNRFGYAFRTPLDVLQTVPASAGTEAGDQVVHRFRIAAKLPDDLPPGLYRLRVDLGTKAGTRLVNLNGYTFATRPLTDQKGTSSYFYSPLLPASGRTVSGREVDGSEIVPRVGSSNPASIMSVVVLPDPEGPSSVRNSPRASARSRERTTSARPS